MRRLWVMYTTWTVMMLCLSTLYQWNFSTEAQWPNDPPAVTYRQRYLLIMRPLVLQEARFTTADNPVIKPHILYKNMFKTKTNVAKENHENTGVDQTAME